MVTDKKSEVENYIKSKEQEGGTWILGIIAWLTWIEKETKEWVLQEWLKNEEDLLTYANLALKDNLNFWEKFKFKILDLKLSITCPYFSDFKKFLRDLDLWNDVSSSDTETLNDDIETKQHVFCWVNVNDIKSEPFAKNSKTWVTRCSKTARYNWENFGLNLPTGDAYKAWKLPLVTTKKTLPEDKNKIKQKPQSSWDWIKIWDFKSITEWNFADIYTDSKSKYGHRAVAFKDDGWQWYVLDPYTRVNWRLDNSPKKLENYLKAKKIVKAHIYTSDWYKKATSHNDEGTWYEWWN